MIQDMLWFVLAVLVGIVTVLVGIVVTKCLDSFAAWLDRVWFKD